MNCPATDELFAFLEKEISVSRATEITQHLTVCGDCSKRWDEIQTITATIESEPNEFASPDFVNRVVSKVRHGHAPEKKRRASRWLIPAAASLAAAGLLFAFGWGQLEFDSRPNDGFVSRAANGNDADRWVSFRVFRSEPKSAVYAPIENQVVADDFLVFSVTNGPGSPYQHLMIFGVQDDGSVFWYHPAFVDPQSTPQSISVGHSTEPIQLREEIGHDLRPGAMRIITLFSKEPLSVSFVESVVAKTLGDASIADLERLAIKDTGQQSILLRVRPRTALE